MKIELLRSFENFERSLSHSLRFFFLQNENKNIEIKFAERFDASATHLVFDKLNLIARVSEVPNNMRKVVVEYEKNPQFFRELLQKLYITCATSVIFRRFFASGALVVSQLPARLENVLIIPGNGSNRIIDLDNNECIVISKNNRKISKHLLKIRAELLPKMKPKILDYDPDMEWFREEFIKGIPANRLKYCKERDREAVSTCFNSLTTLREKTSQRLCLSSWVEGRFMCLMQLLKTQRLDDVAEVIRVEELEVLETKLQSFSEIKDQKVEVCFTHGDLQKGNILIAQDSDNFECFLIDWEYADIRIWFYDHLTLAMNARGQFHVDVGSDIYRDADIPEIEVMKLEIVQKEYGLRLFTVLFVLDELILRVQEAGWRNKMIKFDHITKLSSLLSRLIEKGL